MKQYFIKRLNIALDNETEPDLLTSLYLRYHPELREYYESMLELELELRFPENKTGHKNPINIAIKTTEQTKPEFFISTKRNRNISYKKRIKIMAAILIPCILLFIVTVPFYFSKQEQESLSQTEQKIDPAKLFSLAVPFTHSLRSENWQFQFVSELSELYEKRNGFDFPSAKEEMKNNDNLSHLNSAGLTFSELLNRSVFSNKISELQLPVEPLVQFIDQPIETTRIFLETTNIIHTTQRDPL